MGPGLDEVVGPDMVPPTRPEPDTGPVIEPQPAPLGLLRWDLQPLASPDALQKDIFVGLRWTANDAEDTTVLAGVIQDLDKGGTRGIFVEASRRISGQLKFELEARFFNSRTPRNVFFGLRRDDYVQAKLVYSF